MKKNLLILVLAFATHVISYTQEVPEVQKTLLTKITATWCPNCGTWGWTFFEDIITDNGEKAVFVGAHHNGDLASPPGQSFSANFNAPYQPYFYAGNLELGVTGSNIDSKRQEVKDLVDGNFLQSPIANVGFEASLSDDMLVVNTKTKFFQEATGDYYLGVYILEDGVINNQASNSSMAVHPYVIRAAFTPEIFGNSLANGTVTNGTEFTESFSIQLESGWSTDHLIVAGIIWDKDGDTFQFVNVNATTDFNPTSTNSISPDVLHIELFPTVAKEEVHLNLNLKDQSLKVAVQLYNLNGALVRQIFHGELTQGVNSLDISTNDLTAGLYFVNIWTNEGAVATKRLIVLE